jgi:uncharacterized protein YlxP (DUF503 family)
MAALAYVAVTYHLSGCRSLKERRIRLLPLLDRLGRQRHLALCQAPGDALKAASLAIAVVAPDRAALQQRLDAVMRSLEDDVDGVVVSLEHGVL